MITEEQIEDAKNEVIELITKQFKDERKMNPVFVLIVEDPDRTIPGLMVFPLPPELFRNQETKQKFKDMVLPEIRKEVLDKKGFTALGTCMIIQGDMYIAKKGEDLEDEDDIKEIKKKLTATEILMFSFEGKYGKNVIIYEVDTKSLVTPSGDIKEEVSLNRRDDLPLDDDHMTSISGTFHDLFKFFW